MQAEEFTQTWSISNSDLDAMVLAMYESLEATALLKVLPKHGKSDSFPCA
jgi:hypothetical protein